MDFEKKLKEIEDISAKLSSDKTGVSEGVELFERSVAITKECLDELAQSRHKIDEIKAELDRLLSGADE